MSLLYTFDAELLAESATITKANTNLDADAAGLNNSATATSSFSFSPNVRGIKLLFGVGGVTPTNGMALQKNIPAGATTARIVTVFKGIKFVNINTQMDIVIPRSNAGGNMTRLRKLADGKLALMSPTGSTVLATTSFALVANTAYDLQYGAKTGASTGAADLQLTARGSATVLASLSVTGQSFVADPMLGIRFGANTAPAAVTEWGFDSMELHELATGYVTSTPSAPKVYYKVTTGYGQIDLAGDDFNDSGENLTYTITPNAEVVPTTIPSLFFALPGTYTVVGKNAALVNSEPIQVIVPATTAAGSSVSLRRYDATANGGAGGYV